MSADYKEFLEADVSGGSYDVGFHPLWDRLRLAVTLDTYDGPYPSVGGELWLTPGDARQLAAALIVAANEKEAT